MLRIALAALAILLTAPGAAMAQTPANAEAAQARLNAEIQALAKDMAPNEQLTLETIALLQAVIERSEAATTMSQLQPSRADANRWIATWEPAFKADLANLRARAERIKPFDGAKYPLLMLMGAAQSIDVAALREGPMRQKTIVLSILDVAERIAADEKQAVTGDPEALLRLGLNMISSGKVLIGVENANMESAAATLPPTNPTQAWMKSAIASNRALLSFFVALEDEIFERDIDRPKVVASMRADIADARGQTARMKALASGLVLDMKADPQGAGVLGDKLIAAFMTFDESAANEEEIAVLLADIVERVEGGENFSDLTEALTPFDDMAERRVALHMKRTEILRQ